MSRINSTMQTPMGHSAGGWETPLKTPAFDPRLPFTPATDRTCRAKKQGEVIRNMKYSIKGSPVYSKEAEITIPIGNNQVRAGVVNTLGDGGLFCGSHRIQVMATFKCKVRPLSNGHPFCRGKVATIEGQCPL